jgi:hypothetical protein
MKWYLSVSGGLDFRFDFSEAMNTCRGGGFGGVGLPTWVPGYLSSPTHHLMRHISIRAYETSAWFPQPCVEGGATVLRSIYIHGLIVDSVLTAYLLRVLNSRQFIPLWGRADGRRLFTWARRCMSGSGSLQALYPSTAPFGVSQPARRPHIHPHERHWS